VRVNASIIAILLILAAPFALRAQSSVHGTVLDSQTGGPIVGAAVVVTGTTNGTVTDQYGAFSLTAADSITSLNVSRVGYVSADVSVTNPTEPLRVRLVPAHQRLPGVEVTARLPAPSAVELSESDLQRASGLSLEQSINTEPGLFMQSRTPWGGARITIRGYYPSTSGNSPNSNGLGAQVFLNDIPITDATGLTILDDIDFARLGSVEVIKGPASSQYGSAIGGTVRFNSVRPAPDRTSVNEQVVAGSYGLLRSTSSFETATAHSDLVVDYGYQDYDSFRPHSGSIKNFVHVTGDVNVSERQKLSGYFSYARSHENLAGEIDSAPFYARERVSNAAYLANDSHIDLNSVIAGVTDRNRMGEHFSNQTTLFATGRFLNQPFAHGFTDNTQFNFGGRTAFGYDAQLGRVGLTGSLGALVQRSQISTDGVFILPFPPFVERPTNQENSATNGSIFTEWSATLSHRIVLTAGASLNKNDFAIHNLLKDGALFDTTTTQRKSFDWVVTPRVLVSKGFATSSLVYASVSAGYTPPLLANVIANTGAVDLSLEPERAVQYEIGTTGTYLNDRLSTQLDVFDIENTNKLVSETSNSVTFTTNAGKQRNRGVEAAVGYAFVRDSSRALSLVRPWLSYAFTDAKFIDFKSDNNNGAGTVSFSGNAVPRVPRNTFGAGLDIGTQQGFLLTSSFLHIDKVPVTFDNSTYVRGYDLLSAKLGYRRSLTQHWMLDAFAGGDNLLGNTFYNFLFVGPNIQGLATPAQGGTGDGYIIPGPYAATGYGSVSLRYVF
jgi:iron complex outermembrane recepter protein